VPISKAAPAYAGDNEAVFGGILGLSLDELAELEQLGITPRIPAGGH
jgi:hypothetical protein